MDAVIGGVTSIKIERRMAFADGALGAAGHEVVDPFVRSLSQRVAAEQVTAHDASEQIRAHRRATQAPGINMVVRGWDDYFIAGTTVLQSLTGLAEKNALQRYEEAQSHIRLIELAMNSVTATFDYSHMKGIHKRMFMVGRGRSVWVL